MTLPPSSPPAGTSPLAKALASKLVKVRETRGLSQTKAANQLGLSLRIYRQLEDAQYVPAAWVQERLNGWATEGKTYSTKSTMYPQHKDPCEGKAVRVIMPVELGMHLRRTSGALGLTQQEVVILALEHFLGRADLLAGYKEAVRRLDKIRVLSYLQEDPQYKAFLESDIEVCETMGIVVENHYAEKEPKNQEPETINMNGGDRWEEI